LSVNGVVKERAEDGPAVWVMEMTSPGNLVRAGGWRRDAVKAGEKVEVLFSPLRDAERKGGALKKLTVLATGEVFTANIREQERAGLEWGGGGASVGGGRWPWACSSPRRLLSAKSRAARRRRTRSSPGRS